MSAGALVLNQSFKLGSSSCGDLPPTFHVPTNILHKIKNINIISKGLLYPPKSKKINSGLKNQIRTTTYNNPH